MEVNFFLLLLSLLGLVSFLKRSFSLLHWLYASFLRHPKDLKRVYGPWAVVTGATDGIGLAMSVQLARRGMHLVLVGRNSGRLKKATEHILARCGDAKVRTVVWDLAEDAAGGGGAERLREAIEGVDVGVLLNCAGVTYAGAAYFHEAEERVWREVVKVNVDGTSHVTRVVLPKMVNRRRGAVVNVGSASTVALPSFPLHAIYAATKAGCGSAVLGGGRGGAAPQSRGADALSRCGRATSVLVGPTGHGLFDVETVVSAYG
ncbi:Very-long-chain 3-oxoacyl-CoA reductase 1 [Platanthera guangdongensis]|uniref:Very-long-chain 3-oxoacyl-CoA reductase 1 n=1 Tax=Platanthera guangdongensis TaxID=2320717 RepID=A0ABR2MM19_9ASPA